MAYLVVIKFGVPILSLEGGDVSTGVSHLMMGYPALYQDYLDGYVTFYPDTYAQLRAVQNLVSGHLPISYFYPPGVAITFRVEEVFLQTPGPGAGSKMA